MLLKSLELQGFKSFPDKIKIEFGTGITAIVGPNGSGKSNVSDAIRWVLGEQSGKMLRSSKMEDVIFTGTTQRKPQGFAEVSLTIDNSDHALPTDYDEVTVTRRYYRSGESECFINRTPTRLRDIHELFMDTGIGRDGYSIIGQGRIAEILSHKSEDRRQIIEEVAGISKYRYRKNEAQRKLDATDENLVRLQDIVGELEERLPSLENQSKKAQKYLIMYEEKKDLEISLWISDLRKIHENSRLLEENFNVAKRQLEDVNVEIENLEKEINSIFERNKDVNVEIEQVRRTISELEERKSDVASRIAVLEAGITFEKNNIEKIKSELAAQDERENDLRAQIAERTAEIEESTEKLSEIERAGAALYSELESESESGEDTRRQLDALSSRKLSLSDQQNAVRVRKISLEAGGATKTARIAELEKDISARRESLKAVEDECEALRAESAEKNERKNALQNSALGYRKMLDIKQRRFDEKKAELEKGRLKLQGLEQNLRILSDMEKHLDGYSGSVKTVLEYSRRGTLSGVIGPVSQLIRVDKKYIVAIETALGAAIQNVVTENDVAASNCMDLLRRMNAGRATFLPLTEIKPRIARGNEYKGRGVIGLAHTLVDTSSEAGRAAVEYLLGMTVICETVQDAVAVSRRTDRKLRAVTLDGQVVNAGGSMTGGSTVKSGGLLSRSLDIERLEKQIAAERETLANTEESFSGAQAEFSELSARLEGTESEIRVLDEELHRIADTLDSKSIVADSYNELIAGSQREADSVRASLTEDGKLSKALDGEIETLEKQIADVDAEMSELVSKTDAAGARVEQIRAAIAENELKKVSIFKDVETGNQVIEQLRSQLAAYGDQTRDRQEQIAASEKTVADNESEKQRLSDECAAMEKMQGDGNARIAELIESRNASEGEQTRFRERQRESLATKDRLVEETTRLENRIEGVSDQTGRIIEHLSEYELSVSEAEELAKPLEDAAGARKRVTELKNSIRVLGNVNIESIEEYKSVKERFDFMDGQMNDLRKSKAELEKIIRELLSQMTTIFTEQFDRLNVEFGNTFREMFDGGKAELILTDPDDVLNCGIDIRVAPPGKIIKNIVALSGGEQAFTAIALYFAILRIRPTPFCMMDEIEAALDDVNVNKFASKLRDFCENTQFIVITHRRGTMEEADVLYGVTMQEKGISKMLTIDVNEMERTLKL